jgi:hypothetical protein
VLLALSCGGKVPRPSTPAQDCQGAKVWHQDESARFRGCVKVEGNLELGGALTSASDFSALRQVSGNLVIGPSYQLNDLAALAGLRIVEGSLLVKNNMRLGGLFLGDLSRVGGDVQITGNTALRRVSLHHVSEIGGELTLGEANRGLEAVDLSGLQMLNGVKLQIDWRKARPEAVLRAPLY